MRKHKNEIVTHRKPSLGLSLIPILSVFILLLLALLKYRVDIQIPLITASIIAAVISVVVLKNPWADIEKGIIGSIMNAMQAILIACIIGLIIGSWIAGGIVPSLIYYGLKLLSPRFFLVTCLLVCSVVSVSTGSSWTTCGTLGVAMVGIGSAMGIPASITAGCVVSGAYFGDKMSPFSDTTNLAPAVSGTTLFAHIRHMMYTTSVSFMIACILYFLVNFKYVSHSRTSKDIVTVTAVLRDHFTLSPLLLLPLLILFCMIYFKIPAIPGLIFSVLLGVFCALAIQGASIIEVGRCLSYGFTMDSGNEMLDKLLTKGGLQNMMWTVSLILCSLTFGGIMHQSGMLETIAESILKIAKSNGSLICATGFTAVMINVICGEQYLSILITGKMYSSEYKNRDLAPQNLSRTLEDFGTITSPLIPWTTCAVAISTYLSIPTLNYAPYAFLNLINPFVAIAFAITGFSIKKRSSISPEDIVEA